MAKFAFTTNTYAGEELEGFVASTLLESDTIDRGLVTVHENVKKRAVIKIVDDAVKLQTPAALFNDQGTTAAQDEKYLDPVAMEFMKQEDWSGLIASWEARKLAPGELRNYDGTVDLSEFMINRYLGKLKIAYDRLYWRGKANVQEATFAATYTGLIPKLIAGSDVSSTKLSDTAYAFSAITAATGIMTVVSTANFRSGDVITITALSTGTTTETTPDIFGVAGSGSVLNQSYIVTVASTTTLKLVRNINRAQTDRVAATFATNNTGGGTIQYVNVSNVATVLSNVWAQLDYTAYTDPDFNVMIPAHVARAYATKQGELGVNQVGSLAVPKTMDYNGMKLQIMNHFPANTILGANKMNLHFATDLTSDVNNLSVINLKETTGDKVVRMTAGMSSDGNYVNGGEITLFYPLA